MGSKPRTISTPDPSRLKRSFTDDDRAIEGLPIRLVIALIIGVTSLGIMMQILGGIDAFEGDTEVDVEFDDSSIDTSDREVSVYVVDENGNEVTDATVVAEADSARMDNALDGETGQCTGCDENEVEFNFAADAGLELPPDQSTGEIEFTIYPPSDSSWSDDIENNRLLVVD
ncbi:hypothetical protein OB955_01545 [Halobacteria archaeon AArc-m2/3/4]|uniref:DUF7382 domain-containing protein n=1 Tax=Natronoglomus mannanivorans TaxID=2979990 RepID=A0AAP2YVU3_9EURY|nr:hypothetical protein [Halobacteria archaeon AArc-xg1-1]MCU4971424.1 hypothetical protein [Halobacteria archaeon AArc-m2/3/4]